MKNSFDITDEGALLVKMSRHKSNFDGSICAKPHVHDCGTSDFFRNNYCRRGIPNCGEKDLFHPESPRLVKVIMDENNPFEQQAELIKQDKNPIIFFFTRGRNTYQYYLIGAYIVKSIEILNLGYKPDWTSPSHLLGVYSPFEEDFVPSVATEFILQANDEYQNAQEEQREPKPFILVLDEMNLARAEHYFSDFLSKMQLVDEKKRVIRLYDESKGNHPRLLHIPPNLKIIGTVNIDETSFLFSPKVLDRASYFSLDEFNIEGMGKVIANRSGELRYTELMQKLVIPELRDLNSKLSEFGQPFGYRTAWEIIKWIDTGLSVGVIGSIYEGLDIQVENKILVKLSDYRTGAMFQALATYFKDRVNPYDQDSLIFEKSLQRIEILIARAEREEFAIGQQ